MDNQFVQVMGHLVNRDQIEFASIRDREILVRFSSGYVLKLQPETVSEGEQVIRTLEIGDAAE